MHELSIAGAILDLAVRSTPDGATLRSVQVRAGPMRAIEPDAMQFAWQGTTRGTIHEGVALQLTVTPWHLKCPACGAEYDAPELYLPCACGFARPTPVGNDELRIVTVEVDD